MKNKILSLLLAVCMALPLVGCGEVEEKSEVTKRTRSEKDSTVSSKETDRTTSSISSPKDADSTIPPSGGSGAAPSSGSGFTPNSGSGAAPSSEPESTDGSSSEDEFPMPNLVGMTLDEAVQMYGSYLSLVPKQEYSDVEKDHIIEHDPPEGRSVKRGQTIAVTVSSGRKMSEIFDFKGRQASYAKQQLEREGFETETTYRIDNTIPKDCVIETDPPAHTMAEQGSTVVIIVSTGAKDSSVTVPGLTDMPIGDALKKCAEYFLIPTVKYAAAELPKDTVITQSIEPGKKVAKNTAIELTVSSGEAQTVTANLNFTLPASIKGEFEIQYFVDGKQQNTADPDIRDLSLASNRTISYKLNGKTNETDKRFVIKVKSRATGKEGVFMEISVDFSQTPPKPSEISRDITVFDRLQQE